MHPFVFCCWFVFLCPQLSHHCDSWSYPLSSAVEERGSKAVPMLTSVAEMALLNCPLRICHSVIHRQIPAPMGLKVLQQVKRHRKKTSRTKMCQLKEWTFSFSITRRTEWPAPGTRVCIPVPRPYCAVQLPGFCCSQPRPYTRQCRCFPPKPITTL